ncbi:MAG TPA: hypothetical protein VNN12_03010 [Dehalococcoidia bacterium]|nr:hypothetical protein [Dehalococcoidia bacterium]
MVELTPVPMAPPSRRPLPPLRPYQTEALRAIAESVRGRKGLSFSVEIARQGGKNELSAQLELLLLATRAGRAVDSVKAAPTFSPQARLSMRRLWQRIEQAGLAALASREAGHIVRLGRARQIFLSAEPGANVVGHTAHLLLEVDEAQDVDPDKFDRDFRPMAAASNATVVFYGTAWTETSLLERAKHAHLEAERRDGVRRHFEYDWTAVARHVPAYAAYVDAERRRLGEDHPLFQTQYCLRTLAGGGRLLSPSQRAQLQGSHARLRAPVPGETYVAGLDLAGEAADGAPKRHDATVLTIGRVRDAGDPLFPGVRVEVVEHLAWTGERHDILAPRLADLLREVWRVRRVAVDATGLGETIARSLAVALGSSRVAAVKFSAERKSALGYGLLAAVNTGRLKLYAPDGSPECREFWRQAELARAAYRPNGTLAFFVDASDGHDDYLMSLALLVEAASDAAPRRALGRMRD